MELKPGYKQTEVGVIPEDWQICQLGEVCTVLRGGSPRPIEDYLTENADGINWIKIGDVGAGAKYIDSTAEKILPSGMSRSRYVKPGDFLLSNSMSFGRPYILRIDGCIHDGWLVIGNYQDSFSSEYLYYCLSSDGVLAQYARYAAGSSVLNLNKDIVSKVHVAIPGPQEQANISRTLGEADRLIEQLEDLILKKKNIKQAAMQELLAGKRRLPGFEGEWEVKRLGDVAPLQRGFDLPNPKLEDGPYPVVYSNGVMNHHAAFQVKGPGVVTGRSGTIGKVRYVANDFWPHNTSLWVTSFRGNDPKFIFYLLSSMGIERFASGSGVPTLNRNDLHDQSIRIPSDTREQIVIATVLSDLDTDLEASNQQLAKASALKQGMMQQLLTGKIRLT